MSIGLCVFLLKLTLRVNYIVIEHIYKCLIWSITEMLHNTQLKVWCEGSFQSLSCFTYIRNECMWCLFFIIFMFKAVSKLTHVIIIEDFLFWCTRPQNRFINHSESQCAVAGIIVTTCTIQMLCCPCIIIGVFLNPWRFF